MSENTEELNGGAGTSEAVREPDEEYEVIDVADLKDRIIKIGRCGENETQNVQIDASAFLTALPGATLQIAAVRPQETAVYLPTVTVSDGVITWEIVSTDVAKYGLGFGEVRAVKDGKVKKSAVFRTRVEFGLIGPSA